MKKITGLLALVLLMQACVAPAQTQRTRAYFNAKFVPGYVLTAVDMKDLAASAIFVLNDSVSSSADTFKIDHHRLRFKSGAGLGKVLTSDAIGNATWQTASGNTTQFDSVQIKGTAGNGYVRLLTQSAAPGAGQTNSVAVYSAAGLFSFKPQSNAFVRSFSGTLSANRTYTLPNISTTLQGGVSSTGAIPYWSSTNSLQSTGVTLSGSNFNFPDLAGIQGSSTTQMLYNSQGDNEWLITTDGGAFTGCNFLAGTTTAYWLGVHGQQIGMDDATDVLVYPSLVASNDLVSNNSSNGVVLKSPNGHYWRGTISNVGVVTWTDLGTTRP